jgi:dipeptidyl aminopeptidase/acylaminoacyl peptidase
MKPALSLLLCLSLFCSLSAQEKHPPSFEEIISLQSVSNPQISPDGQHVIFSRSTVDWKENRYDSELWLSKNGGEPFQLTNHPTQSSYGAQWSPDGQWIAFLASANDKTQIHVMRTAGGAVFQASHAKGRTKQVR